MAFITEFVMGTGGGQAEYFNVTGAFPLNAPRTTILTVDAGERAFVTVQGIWSPGTTNAGWAPKLHIGETVWEPTVADVQNGITVEASGIVEIAVTGATIYSGDSRIAGVVVVIPFTPAPRVVPASGGSDVQTIIDGNVEHTFLEYVVPEAGLGELALSWTRGASSSPPTWTVYVNGETFTTGTEAATSVTLPRIHRGFEAGDRIKFTMLVPSTTTGRRTFPSWSWSLS